MKIGELAKASGISVQTIRYYESEGLLPPASRAANNYRHYSQLHLEMLLFIRTGRKLGMSLDEIRQLLQLRASGEPGCREINQLLDTQITAIDHRVAELTILKHELMELRSHCHNEQSSTPCGIISEMARCAGASLHQEYETDQTGHA